jgi:hypothetical protein
MWYLLLVFTIELAGFDKTYLLKPPNGDGFETIEACLEVRAKVYQGMVEAYPDEIDTFKLVCVNPAIKEV